MSSSDMLYSGLRDVILKKNILIFSSGCRADASEAAIILLPSNITVFTLDFSGSGLSGGEHVTLGWHEKDDLKAVVDHLRADGNVSLIGLWGRSMGAVTSLMYGAEDPSIAGMVLDSPFSDLVDLMMELVDTYKFRLPKFTILLIEPRDWRPSIRDMSFKAQSIQDATLLEEPLVEEEVFNALSALNGDKAPGPDGFSMVFWLKRMVNKVVSNFQNAFVGGRQILDAMLIANEAIDLILKSKSSRGLRQGDPLSPYLFVFSMEALSCLLSRVREGGFLIGFKVNGRDGERLVVTHLFFANDNLVFCEASYAHMTYLSWLLMWFEIISGLKINLTKSELIPIGKVEDLEKLALELGYKVGVFLITCLGLPLDDLPEFDWWSLGIINNWVVVKFAIQYMRKAIQKKAKFDITDLNTIKVLFYNIFLLGCYI
ncbi:hypothetical protein CK203_001388 [Vitis vinifera]|uniref:Serine aminopeptidase S33 domain-containing protein n=1 Tax=Vitis vinifera TaxID=29760 RepID=A0A438KKZ3_VITVI|nr:hypothetical protein CK203_001388 [Vitis vinifera]